LKPICSLTPWIARIKVFTKPENPITVSSTKFDHAVQVDSAKARNSRWFSTTLVPFLIGLTQNTFVVFYGVFPLSELCTLAITPFLLPQLFRATRDNKYSSWMILCLLAWLTGQLLSDFANETPFERMPKNYASILLIIASFSVWAAILSIRISAVIPYLVGLALSGAYYMFTESGFYFDANAAKREPWDVKYGIFLLPAALLASIYVYRFRTYANVLIILPTAATAFLLAGRSVGLCLFVAAILTAISGRKRFNYSLGTTAIVTIPAFLVGFLSYVSLAQQGYLGKTAELQTARCDNPYNPIELIFAGREVNITLSAIAKRPILGWGSKAENANFAASDATRKSNTIYAHSILLESWVFAGVLGITPWVASLFMCVSFLPKLLLNKSPLSPLVYVFLASIAWNLLFSPIGYARWSWPIQIALVISFYELLNNSGRSRQHASPTLF
jgi:hypothetical protein